MYVGVHAYVNIYGAQGGVHECVYTVMYVCMTANNSVSNQCSDIAPVHSGVPQGSVLGPILFTMYIKPLSAIIDSHSIIHHSFADDSQLQMYPPPDRISELLHCMQSCISDVKAWATANMLKLNDSKTELMLVTSKDLSISITYLLLSP